MPDEDPIRTRMQSAPTMRDLVMVLFRRRRVFVWVFTVVLACSVLYAITGTKYQANMKILVRRGRADAPVSAALNAPLDLTRTAISEEELNSEVELLRDSEVLRNVVEQTGAGGHDWLHWLRWGEGREQQIERSARRLALQISVQPLKKTNVIAVSYRAGNPDSAANVLRCLGAAYMKKHISVHRPAGELMLFERLLQESRQGLSDSSDRLLDFNRSHGVIAAAQQRDSALQKLSEFEAEKRHTDIEIAETRQRLKELQEQLPSLPERTITLVRTGDNPELLKSLKAELLELQLKRTQLLTKFEANHRLVREVDQQISQTQMAIAEEVLSPVRSETTDKNTSYEWAKSELQHAQVQLSGLEAKEKESQAHAARWREIATRFGEDAIVQDDLLNKLKTAEETYLFYVRKREEARMNDTLDEHRIMNLAIAEQPVAPALPVSSKWSVLALGILGAVVAGVGSALGADYLDPRFRDPSDILGILNTPVLASLPGPERHRLIA
jgi:uncharacterized protein involved in exopolysaccharide biosynthesis